MHRDMVSQGVSGPCCMRPEGLLDMNVAGRDLRLSAGTTGTRHTRVMYPLSVEA